MTRTAYVAALFDRKEEMQGVVARLAANHILSVSRWIEVEHDMRLVDDEEKAVYAHHDLADVMSADMLLYYSQDPLGGSTAAELRGVDGNLFVPASWARGGRHVEFGVALGLFMPVFVIGPRENVFHYHPSVRCFDTTETFLDWYALSSEKAF